MKKQELLKELTKLNRGGILNDAEFLILRKLILTESVSNEVKMQFAHLFPKNNEFENKDQKKNKE